MSADYDDFATWQYFGKFLEWTERVGNAGADNNFASILDKVGLMHTGEAALKHRRLAGKDGLFIDIMHLTAILGV